MAPAASSSSGKLDVLVIGFGALGVLYSYLLERSGDVRVTAIARSTYTVASSKGITIRSQKFGQIASYKPYRVVRHPEEAQDRNYAFIVLCTKVLPELTSTVSLLEPFLGSPTSSLLNNEKTHPTVVLLQNGIGIEKPIREAFPNLAILSGVVWIGANFLSDGTVEHGSLERVDIGVYTSEIKQKDADRLAWNASSEGRAATKELEVFASALKKGGSDVELKEEIQIARWHKNMWNATLSVFCCLTNASVAQVCSQTSFDSVLPALRRSMLEVIYVARAMGYDEETLPARVIDSLLKLTVKTWGTQDPLRTPRTPFATPLPSLFPEPHLDTSSPHLDPGTLHSVGPNFRPSMLVDLESGRPTELEAVLGSVLDRARMTGTDTPRLDLLYGMMKIRQQIALDAERQRLRENPQIGMVMSPNLVEAMTSPSNDRVRGRPVFTPAITDEDERFENSWPSLV